MFSPLSRIGLLRLPPPPASSGGWGWAVTPGSDLPAPETAARKIFIRIVALVALLVSAFYLIWRALFTVDVRVWWASIPLLLLEIHAALGLALFAFSLWDLDGRAAAPATRVPGRVAVLIPTFNEGPEVLLPTVAAALAMRLEHETWILDDGNRPEVRELAEDLGARYLARTDHQHAKAGNINHALTRLRADFVAVLDADHVASPEFLERTLGYFDDPRVALVQTPQDFYNLESFEHDRTATERAQYHEQALFYRIIQPGKNRWQAAFWCGTGAVVRLSALNEVGGVATETLTEDIHTTIRLHRRGWKTVYHNEVLARGLAAGDAASYQLQRLRWGTGAMQVLRRENPLFCRDLTIGQQLAYAATLLGWFDAWRTLGYLIMPIIVVVSGVSPINAAPEVFFPAFLLVFALQQLAMHLLSRGFHRPILSIVFELVRMAPNLKATLSLLIPRRQTFQVTPKGRTGDGRRRVPAPLPLVFVAVASLMAGIWFPATLAGLTPVAYKVPWAVFAAMVWLGVNGVLVALAIERVRSLRFAPERRASVRFPIEAEARIDGQPATALDVSLTGARIVGPVLEPRDRHEVTLLLGGTVVSLDAAARTARPAGRQTIYGFEFDPSQRRALAGLALALFATRIRPIAAPIADLEQAA